MEEKTMLRALRAEYLTLIKCLMSADDIVYQKMKDSEQPTSMGLYFSAEKKEVELKERGILRFLEKELETHRHWTRKDLLKNRREFIQEIRLMVECIQKDVIESFHRDHSKIFLLEEKNNESFHFRTLLCGCFKDVATWFYEHNNVEESKQKALFGIACGP